MRAVALTRFGGPEVLEVREVAAPEPGRGEVVVDVAAVSLNNTDVWTRSGAYGADEPAGWLGPIDFPRIQGADVCGRGYAEQVLVRSDRVHDVTSSPLTDEQLACLPICYGTATGMLERAGVRAGQTVLVSGASGGVGLALVGLAAGRGARVIALSSGDRADAVRLAGADVVIDRKQGDIGAQLAELAPAGLDAVADVVGGLVATVMPHVRAGGRWVVAGAVAGPVIELDLRGLYLRSISLLGSTMHTPVQFEALVAAASAGQVHPVVAWTFPLEEVRTAHAEFERRAHIGKLVLLPRHGQVCRLSTRPCRELEQSRSCDVYKR